MTTKKMGYNKSGDSKLQDAKKVQQRVDVAEEPPSKENIAERLQAAPEEARARGDSDERVKVIEESMKLLLQSLQQMTTRVLSLEASKVQAPTVAAPTPRLECGTCRQMVKSPSGAGVCDGEHTLLFVAPRDFDLYRAFPGICVNGVLYVGRQFVPVKLVNGIQAMVSHWEHSEKRKHMRGGKVFQPTDIRSMAMGQTPVIA